MSTRSEKDLTGVILMTYGSATVAEHVGEYFERIYEGKASEALITDFENRYRLVGQSPLIEISNKQALFLEEKLGHKYIVKSGMRYSSPFIEDAVAECCVAGAKRIIGIILSPQLASFIKNGYQTALIKATRKYGFNEKDVVLSPAWPVEGNFVKLLADQITRSLGELRNIHGPSIPVIFTTHSLPKRVVENDYAYIAQLKSTSDAVLKVLNDPSIEWHDAYQSAGHTPEEWLKPDLVDILALLSLRGVAAVLIVPIQFLADHLEVLYDLDIAAKNQCEKCNIKYHRIQLPNTDNLFIDSLSSIVKRTENIF